MCTGAEMGWALAAIGAAAQATNQMVSNRRQDRAAAAGLRRQAELQRDASADVHKRIAELGQSTAAGERAEALEGFLNTLRESADITGAERDPLSLGGGRFAERVEGGESDTRREGREAAIRESIISGAVNQRRRETGRTGDLVGRLREAGHRSAAEDFITRLRVASKRPNAFVDLIGAVLKGAGGVMALTPSVPSGAALTGSTGAAGSTIVQAPTQAGTTIFSSPIEPLR